MPEIRAKLNYLRIAPRKVRLVANLIKGKPVIEAKNNLNFLLKKSAISILKLLNSAINNAKKFNLSEDKLYIKRCIVNEGYKLKRWIPRAFGRAAMIRKRTSNIEIVLDELKESKLTPKTTETELKFVEKKISDFDKKFEESKVAKKLKTEKILGKKSIGIKRKLFQRKAV